MSHFFQIFLGEHIPELLAKGMASLSCDNVHMSHANLHFRKKMLIFLRTTTKGPPPRCLPQGPHHPRFTLDDKSLPALSSPNHVIISDGLDVNLQGAQHDDD